MYRPSRKPASRVTSPTTGGASSCPPACRQPIVDKIYAATQAALQAPAVKAQFDREGATVLKMTSAEFTDYIKSEIAKWERVVKEGNFKAK